MPKKFRSSGYQPKGHGPSARKMFPISMRLTEEARDQLVRAAEASGRSLAAETEHRLARSFFADDHVKDLQMRIAALEANAAKAADTIQQLSLALAAVQPERLTAAIEKMRATFEQTMKLVQHQSKSGGSK